MSHITTRKDNNKDNNSTNKNKSKFIFDKNKIPYIALALLVIFAIGFTIYSYNSKDKKDKAKLADQNIVVDTTPAPKPKIEPEEEPEEIILPIIDLSDSSSPMPTSMQRINEPIPYGKEILYSAGNSEFIDEPVFQELYILDLDTGEERAIAKSEIRFGEIYEGRFNGSWVSWLDTNQSGENKIYVQDRKTKEITHIKSSEFNKPQLRLGGDNLIWIEQRDMNQDVLYLYNFKSGEPIVLEIFNNPTYGTCPPSIFEDTMVWVAQDDDINDTIDVSGTTGTSDGQTDNTTKENADENAEKSPDQADESLDDADDTHSTIKKLDLSTDEDPEIIDPKGFAIYPITNGQVVAWLDNLNPENANLDMTLDNGKNIIQVAESVGRPYGIGDGFIAYMKDDAVMVYFWELDRHAQLNKPGTKARLTQGGVWGDRVVWYCADNPNEKKDNLMVSIVAKPTEEQLAKGD